MSLRGVESPIVAGFGVYHAGTSRVCGSCCWNCAFCGLVKLKGTGLNELNPGRVGEL